MPIYVKRSVDPATPAARRNAPTILAENVVCDQLKNILWRYVTEEVNGRSYLVSGHRGAGKTTLIQKIVRDVDLLAKDQSIPRRPLLVTLQGPMLLPATRSRSPAQETEAVLKQIALNLYQALARHVVD